MTTGKQVEPGLEFVFHPKSIEILTPTGNYTLAPRESLQFAIAVVHWLIGLVVKVYQIEPTIITATEAELEDIRKRGGQDGP